MKPKANEGKQDFLKRCTTERMDNGEKQKAAYAACNLDWDNANKQRSRLGMSLPVEILAAGDGSGGGKDQKRSFLITAYTGTVIDRLWGSLIIALSGIKTKKKMPILREHECDRIVGSGKTWTDENGLYASGNFSKVTHAAKEVLALADEGYPWQASMYVRAKKVKRLRDEKESEIVNGQEIKGPADIWLESEVGEVSFVSLGADGDTAAIAFSDTEEKTPVAIEYNEEPQKLNTEDDIMEFTLEKLAEEAPELLKSIRDDAFFSGAKAERDRVVAILKADGNKAVTLSVIEDGTPSGDAFQKFYEALKQEKKDGLEKLGSDATKPLGQEQLDEDYEDPDKKDTRPADKKLMAMAAERAKEKGIPLDQAQVQIFKENPDLADEWTPNPVQ